MTNADKFKAVFGMYSEEFWAKPEGDMLNWINSEYQEPTSKVDVQPVVRCKDCVYRPYFEPSDSKSVSDLVFPDYSFNLCPCRVEDIWYSWMPDDDWFCAYGKRKDGET